jgi:hypothetical protein
MALEIREADRPSKTSKKRKKLASKTARNKKINSYKLINPYYRIA